MTGHSFGSTLDDYATVGYDAFTGAKLWAKRYDAPASDDDWAYALAVSPDGMRVFVTGESWGTDLPDFATVAYRTE